MKWLIVVVVAFVLIGGGFFAYYAAQLRGSDGLTITMTVPETVKMGVPFDIEVELGNQSGDVLNDVRLKLSLPSDAILVGSGGNKTVESRSVGSIGSGSLNKESFKVMMVGGGNSIKAFKVTASYVPGNLSSHFEVSASKELTVSESELLVDVEAPQKVLNNEEFEMKVRYKNNSASEFVDLQLRLNYPPVFTYKSATREPDADNNVWELGDLRSGSEGAFTIKGTMIGPDNAFFDLKAELYTRILGNSYKVSEKVATLTVAPSPLSLSIALNDKTDYIAHPKDRLLYVLTYQNNTDVGLKDVIIKAKLTGAMFDIPTLETDGSLSPSENNTIVWNAARVPALATIPAGGSGSVQFKIMTKVDYPIFRLSDKNFMLKVQGTIESPTVPYFVAATKTIGLAELETKVAGQLYGTAIGYFRDAPSGILNSGTVPPKVGKATQYTIHWSLENTSTDIENVTVSSFLGPNVKFTGVAKSTTGVMPTYNERTQEIVWTIDKIPATRGALGQPTEAIFQVELTPAPDQLNFSPTLVQRATVKGKDTFVNQDFSFTMNEVTTSLPYDTTTKKTDGTVVQ